MAAVLLSTISMVAAAVPSAGAATVPKIRTIAGGGVGDGGSALNASVNPAALATDAAGNVFFADGLNDRVVEVTTSGVIEPVAGNGTPGYTGDGGPATSAQLAGPTGVALDAGGNVFIADGRNNVIRKVSPSGTISTFAGNATSGFAGDGGPTAAARFNGPSAVAFDSAGNLFVSDTFNNRVRRIDTAGVISTVAGNGSPAFFGDGGPATAAGINNPGPLAISPQGTLYISDTTVHFRIRRVDTSGIITTVAGNGTPGFSPDGTPAVDAPLANANLGAADAAGNVFMSDEGKLREITSAGILTTVPPGLIASNVVLTNDGFIITSGSYIKRVDGSGNATTIAGNGEFRLAGDGLAATSATMWGPYAVAVDPAENIYISDTGNQRVRKVSAAGIITSVTGIGAPAALATDPNGNLLFTGSNQVLRMTPTGVISTVAGTGTCGFSGDNGPAVDAELCDLTALAADSQGNVYLADGFYVRKVDAKGVITTIAGVGCPLTPPPVLGMPLNPVCPPFTDVGVARAEHLLNPAGIAVDTKGNVYVTDQGLQRVVKITPSGLLITIAGNGKTGFAGDGGPGQVAQLNNPVGVSVDAAGNVYFSDSGNNRVRKVTPSGTITTVVGTGRQDFLGDLGPATSAALHTPDGLTFDPAGRLLIVDNGNGRLRAVS